MNPPEPPPGELTLDHWLEWKEICAVESCSPPARGQLSTYLTNLAYLLAPKVGFFSFTPADLPPEHLFDRHNALEGAQGKSHKDWMLSRCEQFAAGHPDRLLAQLNIHAMILMRSALRDACNHESHEGLVARNHPAFSLDQPIGDEGDTTFLDLLEDASTEVEADQEAYAKIAAGLATELLPQLDTPTRILLVTHYHGLKLNHPAVTTAAGVKKSQLYGRNITARTLVKSWVEKKYPEESDAARYLLIRHTLAELANRAWELLPGLPGGPELISAALEHEAEATLNEAD
jgi:hypothetical protein